MTVLSWLLASDVFASGFNGIVLARLARHNGYSVVMALLALVMFASALMTGGHMLITAYGTVAPRQFKPGWFWFAVAIGILRSASLWAVAIYITLRSTSRQKG